MTSLIWFSYLLDASDGKVTLDNIKSTVGFGAIYVIFYNAPIYYLFIISLEFICKKLEDKFLFQFLICILLGILISNLFCLLIYNKLYIEMYTDILNNGCISKYLFHKTNWALDYILCYSAYGFIFPILYKTLNLYKNENAL